MSVEISRIGHFSGEGLPALTEVLRAKLDERNDMYFLSPYDRDAPQQVSTIALTVEKTDTSINPSLSELLITNKAATNKRESLDRNVLLSAVKYPGIEMAFESSEEITPPHMAMLAHAALDDMAFTEVTIRGEDENAQTYRTTLGMRETHLAKRNLFPVESEPGYVGDVRVVVGFVAAALRQANITRSNSLPNLPQ